MDQHADMGRYIRQIWHAMRTMRTGTPREGDNTEARREDTSRGKGIAGAETKVSMITRIRETRRGGEEEGREETVARMTTRVKAGV